MSATYCNPCSVFRKLPSCMTNLTVGTIANRNTAVYIYLKNHTTNHIYRFSTTSDAVTGIVTFDITDAGDFSLTPNHDYELYIILQSSTNNDERVTFSVNSINYTCAAFTVETINFDSMDVAAYTNQTLKLES